MSIFFTSLILSGCGTLLNFSELNSVIDDGKQLKEPDGLVINRLANYQVEVEMNSYDPNGNKIQLSPEEVLKINSQLSSQEILKIDSPYIAGVDHTNVIKVDVMRMPFSDGKLTVKLNEFQLIKEVELTSKTGAEKAANAAQTGIDKFKEIKTILKPKQTSTP